MKYPVIIAAFGTTTRARSAYKQVDAQLKQRFPYNDIYWAYTSRVVRTRLEEQNIHLPTPQDVLNQLANQGHQWAVVQSYAMLCGHEFYRLKDEVLNGPLRVSIGHSLLCEFDDFVKVIQALAPYFEKDPDEAVILVGHGTDHCCWSVYPAFEHLLIQQYGHRAFVGAVEGDWGDCQTCINQIQKAGFKKVRLVPFMIVAGRHFVEDLTGPEDSWQNLFENQHIQVSVEPVGIGADPSVVDIFGDHIYSALDIIP